MRQAVQLLFATPLPVGSLAVGADHGGEPRARHPDPDGPVGLIESGAYADLLIVDGDPLTDIQATPCTDTSPDHERRAY